MVIRIKLLLKKLCFVSIGILKERMTSRGVHSFICVQAPVFLLGPEKGKETRYFHSG